MAVFIPKQPHFLCVVHLTVLRTVCVGLALSIHKWLLHQTLFLSSYCTATVVSKREAEREAERQRETEFKDSRARARRDA